MIFKLCILSPFIKPDNRDLDSIRNINKALGQDDFPNSYLVPIHKTWQLGPCHHQKYLHIMGPRWFSKLLLVPILKTWQCNGDLVPSKIFTNHVAKMIFKLCILSPFIKTWQWDLVSIRNIYKALGQEDFPNCYIVPILKTLQCQWGSCLYHQYLLSMETRWFLN